MLSQHLRSQSSVPLPCQGRHRAGRRRRTTARQPRRTHDSIFPLSPSLSHSLVLVLFLFLLCDIDDDDRTTTLTMHAGTTPFLFPSLFSSTLSTSTKTPPGYCTFWQLYPRTFWRTLHRILYPLAALPQDIVQDFAEHLTSLQFQRVDNVLSFSLPSFRASGLTSLLVNIYIYIITGGLH
jgi:hypothetical protein